MIDVGLKCIGCEACVFACPKGAIRMVPSENGYFYPHIDSALCVRCGRCDVVCPVLKEKAEERGLISSFLFSNPNEQDLLCSSSGGAAFVLARYFIEKQGIVYGVVWNSHNEAVYQRFSESSSLETIQKSKYVDAQKGTIFVDVKKDLQNGKLVLFVGLPCLCFALRSFLELAKVPLDSFFDISLRCGGNLSSLYLLQYIKYIEKKHKKTVNKIDFRSKDYGAKILCTKITFSDYSSFYANGFENGYISLLGSRFVRPSCFLCSYNGYLVSDFVLGDVFHGIPRKKGTSFVGVLSEKGARFLACLISRGGFCEFDIKDSPQIQEFRHEKSCLNLEELFKEQTLFYEQSSSDFSSAYKLFVYSGFSRRQRLYSRMPYIFKRWITK